MPVPQHSPSKPQTQHEQLMSEAEWKALMQITHKENEENKKHLPQIPGYTDQQVRDMYDRVQDSPPYKLAAIQRLAHQKQEEASAWQMQLLGVLFVVVLAGSFIMFVITSFLSRAGEKRTEAAQLPVRTQSGSANLPTRTNHMEDIAKELTKFEGMSARQQRKALAELQRLASTETEAGKSILQRLGIRKDVILSYNDLLHAQEKLNQTINRMNNPSAAVDNARIPSISAAHQSHAMVDAEATTLFMQLSADPSNQQRYFQDIRSRYASEPRIADEVISKARKMLQEAAKSRGR